MVLPTLLRRSARLLTSKSGRRVSSFVAPPPKLSSPSHALLNTRCIHSSGFQLAKSMPPRPKPPPEEDMEEAFLKGSGPGGQKINKTNSAVQLKHIPTGTVVKCQATRSRSQNRKIARQLLADRLDDLACGGESRSSVVGAVKRKKKASSAKKSRRKYRKLEEEQAAAAASAGEEYNIREEELGDEQEEEEDLLREGRTLAQDEEERGWGEGAAEDEKARASREDR
ncbi:RF-1 domain-containing protein [Xylariomycetidae sp. FL0641]|nr:RF-1 domain-containing protein [Xylariomycetidae sp. FL0641]